MLGGSDGGDYYLCMMLIETSTLTSSFFGFLFSMNQTQIAKEEQFFAVTHNN